MQIEQSDIPNQKLHFFLMILRYRTERISWGIQITILDDSRVVFIKKKNLYLLQFFFVYINKSIVYTISFRKLRRIPWILI